METSNLLDAEFKILVIRMLKELRERLHELNDNFNKEIGNISGTRKHKNEPVRNEEYIN